MTRLQRERIREIRDYKSSWRPFRCVPENCGAFQRANREMMKMVGDLLDMVEPPSQPNTATTQEFAREGSQ